MASNNIILAVPSANSSVNYELPDSESAQLSFTPEDIDGIKLDANGGLVISFVEGGNVTLSNFQSFIDNGNTLSLADGTKVDPKLLFNALGGQNDNPFPTADVTKIGIPSKDAQNDITLEPGKKYLFNFDLSETQGANVKDGKMVIDFENGGKIVIANYETAMADKNPPELSLASKTCIVSGDDLITNIQELAKANPIDPTVLTEEEQEALKRKSKVADADMEGKEDIGPGGETDLGYKAAKIQPAAGDPDSVAEQLAKIETAAGAAAGPGGGGYRFGSRFAPDPFVTNPDIGPINPTQLGYRAPILEPSVFIIRDQDGNPIMIQPDAKFIDETNLAGGPIVVNGQLNIDFGADGPGGVGPNGTFTSGGSQTGGKLSHNGVDVEVSVVGNTYIGVAGDVKVFELTIDPVTGAYKFTQFENIDHADGSNPNDQIALNFGVTARDGDGDPVSTTIQIVIADDVPEIEGSSGKVDETDFGATISTSGNLAHDYGQDGPGKIETTGQFSSAGSQKNDTLSSAGVAVSVTSTATGYVGKAGDVVVFTLTINPANGNYTYTQFHNLDHADGSNPNDEIVLTFGAKIVDYDGDSDSAPIVITVADDGPDFQTCGCGPKPDKGFEIVDETNLKGGPVVETGKLDADFGADVPGSYGFKPNSFTTSNPLTHNGVPVVVSLVGGEWVGKAGDLTIFKLEMNVSTGDYKFTLYDNVDHPNASNPDDQITLDFAVIASDNDGDGAEGSIRIIVKDDGPNANNDVNTYDTTFGVANGNVISGLNGGPGAADVLSTDGKTNGSNENTVVKIAFGGNEVDVPAVGTVSIDGQYGKLTIAADGTYTYEAFDNGGMIQHGTQKEFVSGPALPDFDESEALDNVEKQSLGVAPGNLSVNGGETVTVKFHSEQAGYGNTMGVFTVGPDGKLRAETVLVKDGNAATAGQSFNYTAAAGATSLGFFIVADGAKVNHGYAGIDFSKGTLDFVYNYGQPGAREAKITDDGSHVKLVYTSEGGVKTVIDGPLYFTSDRGSMDNLNADGTVRVVSGVPNGDEHTLRIGFEDLPCLGDKDYNDFVFDVSIKGQDCGCGDPDIKDQFVYTLKDGDGDTDKAMLTLNGQDLTDDQPIITAPAAEIVDETDLKDGVITETGVVTANFGSDGPGTIEANNSFNSSGSKLNNALTSGGVAVQVTLDGNTYVGKAGNVTVFTLAIQSNGSYTFKLYEQLDHADGNNPNDEIALNFGVKAIDCDGDKADTTITVKVKDDAPDAKDDGKSAVESGTVTGNVTSNDVVGQDTPGTVTKVTFGNQSYDVPANGSIQIVGQYGKLTIDKTGAYSYTANSNNPNGTDSFVYTLKDNDGDKDTACLSINVTSTNDCPVIVKPAIEIVDETNLKDGVITETGTVSANYFGDGPGAITANNSFASSGSKLNGNLTSGGVAVQVTLNGNTYEGKANGVTVFTMQVGTNGAYTFKLFEQLDHADGNNPNDVITLDFGVTATDADGDKDSTTITVNVKDDAPDAKDDGKQASEGGTITGNVTDNDVVGQDVPGTVTKVQFGNQSYNVPTNGTVQIVGQYGKLTIDKTGAYSYTANSNNPNGVDAFTYTLKDNDGDTDTACLSISVTCNNDVPTITSAVETVDETGLVITETGSVTASYGADAPGSITPNGSFIAGGSKLNGNLTSNGVTVSVLLNGNTYEGKANGVTVFTLQVGTNGAYTYKQYEQLDHADGNNPNDIISLQFGVKATDADGDSSASTITINVKDDAPDAKDDGKQASEGGTVTGNVTDNDVVGQDTPGTVTKVKFGNQTYDVPANGTIQIVGQYGKLTIDKTGAYSYTAHSNNPNGTDSFTYTLKDYDGDTDTACLSIDVTCNNDVPTITAAVETIDETNLASGVITETGSVTASYGADAPGSIAPNNSFVSSGSKLNGNLTSGGVAVNVTLNGNTYEGKANGVTVFTLQVGTNGAYTFKLFEQLDHADGNNPNDIISLQFGVKATDADGDSTNSTITVNVKDDAPDAKDDGKQASEGGTVTGNVTDNDIVGQDVPGTVTKVQFGNQSYNVPASGTVQIVGQYGTLTIDKTGAYSYTAHNNNPNGTDSFTYTLKDNDGDTDTACLSISVTCNNDVPTITSAVETVDETGLVITETGNVTASYGADGPGSIAPNNSFVSSGSKLNGNLTSNGVAVQVTLNGNTYEGKANGVTVFTLQVGTNGAYTYKQYEQLDHADGNNPNDIISLQFGVKATDADGDSSNATITVNVKDDAPDAKDDGKQASEGGTVTGNVTDNDIVGQDTPGTVTKVQFGNQSYNVPANGTVQIVGQYGTLTIDKTGAYSYTAHNNNPNGTDSFTYTLKDYDGDTDTACLAISVTCNNDVPTITAAVETIDETNLASGIITETGSVTATYGADGPGSIAPNNSFVSSGSKLNGNLTSGGVAVQVTLNGNTYEGKANGVTVFTLQVGTNGAYTFKLFEQLDHADGSNPNDIISLQFGVKATDADGDSTNSTITVNVKDDAPDAKDDGKQASEGGTVTGNVTDNDIVGQDVPGTVTKVQFGNQSYNVPANGTVQIVGQYGTLTIDKTGAYSYTAHNNNPNGVDSFTYTLKDNDGDTDTACLSISVTCNNDVPTITAAVETIDETNLASGVITETGSVTATYGADGPGSITPNNSFASSGSKLNGNLTSGGVAVNVTLNGNTYEGKANGVTVFTLQVGTNGAYTFKLFEQLDHADGSNPNDIISLQFGVKATDADGDSTSSTITVNVKDDAPDAKDDGKTATEGQTVTGNVTSNDIVGQDVPGTVTKVQFGNQSYNVPANGTVQVVGQYGTLTIDKTGAYSYTAHNNNPNGVDAFTYTLKDNDGDTDTACLSFTVTCNDDQPTITCAVETIDETDLASGIITEGGNVVATYGNDGPGAVTANGSFTSGGSKLNGNLTSGGVPVSVGLNGNTYEGKANGVLIFTLTVQSNGAYSFKLYEQLDHADGNNPNDIIELNFGVKATDADGDVATGTVTINVKDDAPDARDDGKTATNTTVVTGNVTDNDIVGQDVPGAVTKIQFNGVTKDVPASGTVSITGAYGTLVIDKTGAYTYTVNPNANGTDNFTYTLKDNDGDKDTACLSIVVKNDAPPPVVCINVEDACVKEDGNINVPVTASFTGGSGNETMTISLSGVPTGWVVTGWTNNGGGNYSITLPQGQKTYDGQLNFKPPANSDVDLNSLSFKASVYDPDTNASTIATDKADIIVDAVIDPLSFTASAQFTGQYHFTNTWENWTKVSKININNITHPDADGSESLKSIKFTLDGALGDDVIIAMKNNDGTYSQAGVKGTSGNDGDTTYTIDLSGMTYDEAKNFIQTKLYLYLWNQTATNGSYDLGITIVSYEKNLSGIEKDYTDNQTSYTVTLPILFCLSPLVIDMDGDGVELLSQQNGVMFDMDNDGAKDQTGWAAKDDALLVLDKNKDGLINDRSELFGNDEQHSDGFANLASYDLNNDGVIDMNDDIFQTLQVWQDANSDGISQASEMRSLADVGIKSINLHADEVNYDIAGNPITHESTVTYEDGSSSQVVDAWFAYQGGAGVDKGLTLRGTDGSDVMAGGSGNDELYGGTGADTFLFQTIAEGVDTIKDFNAAEGDKLDLSNVLTNYDPVTHAITDFVFATETDDGKTILSVNTDGTGGAAAAHQFAIIESTNVSVTDLFNNGSIIV